MASQRAHTRRATWTAVAVSALVALALPTAALAGPATDEYSLDLPDAKGKPGSAEELPVTRVDALPPAVANELRSDPDGKALAAIATAEELGAPGHAASEGFGGVKGEESAGGVALDPGDRETDGSEPSALAAATGSVDDPAVAGVLLGVIALGGVLLFVRNRLGRAD
jgi:hypothetical protein